MPVIVPQSKHGTERLRLRKSRWAPSLAMLIFRGRQIRGDTHCGAVRLELRDAGDPTLSLPVEYVLRIGLFAFSFLGNFLPRYLLRLNPP